MASTFATGCATAERKAAIGLARRISSAVCRLEPLLEVAEDIGAEPGSGVVRTSTTVRGFAVIVEFPETSSKAAP